MGAAIFKGCFLSTPSLFSFTDYDTGSSMSSPQASSNEKENEGGLLSPMRPASKQPIVEASVEGQDELPEEAVTGKWRGHLGSLFSPMLRIFGDGGDEVAEVARKKQYIRALLAAKLDELVG